MVVGLQATWSRLNLTNRLKVEKLLWYVCLTFAKHICIELYNISDTTWNNGVLWDQGSCISLRGANSERNRHKDYLFQKKLAKALPIDSFRFDFRCETWSLPSGITHIHPILSFRGSHETGGVWKMGALHEDLEDLEVVVQYLSKEFGYVVDLVVGHSRGSVVAMRWLCIAEEAKHVRGFVNVSGRYRMEVSRLFDYAIEEIVINGKVIEENTLCVPSSE